MGVRGLKSGSAILNQMDSVMPYPATGSASRADLDLALALRRATAGVHAEIELLPLMAQLTAETVTLEAYQRYLHAMVSLLAPLERTLFDAIDPAIREQLGVRPKLPALLADLDEQGLTYHPGLVAMTATLALPHDLSATVGGLYVLEGATLGGRTIARHLRRRLGESLGAARFLDFHSDQTAAAWKAFTAALNTLALHQALVPDQVIAGALAVFAYLHQRIEGS